MVERMVMNQDAQLWVGAQGEGQLGRTGDDATAGATAGAPIMLCNGGPGCCDYLEPVGTMLADLTPVYRFEQRGCGRSSATPPYDVQTCVDDLEAIRRALGHERWVVGGHSWGADLALAYALAHAERVQALLLLSGGRVHNDRDWHEAYRAGRDAGRERLPTFAYPPNLQVNAAVNRSWKAFIKHPLLLRRLAALDIPTLAVYGSDDIRPSWPVEQVANLLPRARFELIEGAGHYLWLTHADALRIHLRRFVYALPSGG
jgi:proline iminopeptidase